MSLEEPRMRLRLLVLGVTLAGTAASPVAQQGQPGIAPVTLDAPSYTFVTAEHPAIRVVVMARGLVRPFSVALLPDGDALVVERGSGLRIVRNAAGRPGTVTSLEPEPVTGVPEIPTFRTGGLQDVVLHPRFAENRLVYLSYNKAGEPGPGPGQRQSAVAVARGRFDGQTLSNVQEIFAGEWQAGASGSRLAFGLDGRLYVTTGAPFNDAAQDPGSVYGKVLRLEDDGRIPADNPFVGREGARPEVFSIGHRDQLGLAVHPVTGAVLAAEHGPNGGDEINLILPGRNYGWPKVSFGRSYEGPPVAPGPTAEGVEPPIVVWLPSIAPAGLTFYDGDRFPAWKGHLFVGSARRGQLPGTGGLERVVFNDQLEELRRETLLTPLHRRIRDVRQGPDGLLYVVTDDQDGALLRIEPD
jgi:aldose sugar dehydrogenase